MWRPVICFLCVSFVSSEQLSLKSGLTTLSDELAKIEFTGSKRADGEADGMKKSIANLLKSVSSVEKLDDGAKSVLQQVSTLLAQILIDLASARDAVQTEADKINPLLDACTHQDHVDEDAQKETSAQSHETNHSDCRTQEDADHASQTTACDAANQFTSSLSAPSCSVIEGGTTEETMQDWIEYFDGLRVWFGQQDQLFTPLKLACDTATTTSGDKKTECDQAMIALESSWCNWVNYRRGRCHNQGTCYTDHKGSHSSYVAQETPVSNQRENDAMMISYVKCLVDALVDGATDSSAWEESCALTKASNYDAYNNEWPSLNSMTSCDDVSMYPGHADWETTKYGDWDTGGNSGLVVIPANPTNCSV